MLEIRLIGKPALCRDGAAIAGPRGNKAWALLGRLVRSADPVSRQTLVDELFSEADDPMGALRWSLAELRRRTGLTDGFVGNPVSSDLGAATDVDVVTVAHGELPAQLPEGEFLEGIEIKGAPGFESWLLVERQRVAGEILSVLRQDTLRALSGRRFDRAIDLAGAMVRRAPFEEGPHILLIKSLAASGDPDAALRQAEMTEALFSTELGVDASPAVRAAARPAVAGAIPGVSARASAASLRDAGLAAVSAGAADAGIECLRGASAAAEESGDPALLGECLMELGTALVHSVRGYDDEGAVILGQATETAIAAGVDLVAAKALSELAYIDIQAGRRLSASGYLDAAGERADGDPSLLAGLAGFDAMNLSDWGRLDASADRFAEALELSRSAGVARREIWNLGLGARTLFLVGRVDEAIEWARLSAALADEERWTAFRPWPDAWLGQARLASGESPAAVRTDVEATFALARHLNDPCWEGVSAKVLGLTYVAENDFETGLGWLANTGEMCGRVTDSYTWLETEILVTEAQAAMEAGDRDRADSVARRAVGAAAMGTMDGLLERAVDVLAAAGG